MSAPTPIFAGLSTFEKFLLLWAILFFAGVGWDMGKGLSRTIRFALMRWWRRRRARRAAP